MGETVQADRELASWLVAQRIPIEGAMTDRLGPAAPTPASAESEALRRFRSFASTTLLRGRAAAPALEGLRVNERRMRALLDAWTEAACTLAGERGDHVRSSLRPLLEHFRVALRTTDSSRRSKGAPRAQRRAVIAAIDRVADAFLAVDTDSGEIVDANPAAGALLGVQRDALLGVPAFSFVPDGARDRFWHELDAASESEGSRRFHAELVDRTGLPAPVEASVTRFAARGRTLALLLMRPTGAAG